MGTWSEHEKKEFCKGRDYSATYKKKLDRILLEFATVGASPAPVCCNTKYLPLPPVAKKKVPVSKKKIPCLKSPSLKSEKGEGREGRRNKK